MIGPRGPALRGVSALVLWQFRALPVRCDPFPVEYPLVWILPDAIELVEDAGETGAEDGVVECDVKEHLGTRSFSGCPLVTSGFSLFDGDRPLIQS